MNPGPNDFIFPESVNSGKLLIRLSAIHGGARRRLLVQPAARAAIRAAGRSALRSCLRRATRRATRHVLKDQGPTLRDVCAVIEAYLRLSKAYDKKWHPPSRFKTLCSSEELERRTREDLERAYGDNSPFVRAPTARAAAPSASGLASEPPPPAKTAAGGALVAAPAPQSGPKADVTSVPIVRLPNGLLTCDWTRARPA